MRATETAFRAAVARTGSTWRDYRIGGRLVRLEFAGGAAVPAIDPAIAHLAVAAGASAGRPELTVRAWDSHSTGVPIPDLPGATPEGAAARQDSADADAAILSAYHVVPQILSLYDRSRAEAIWWVPDARRVSSNEVASPLRTILHWWARDHGLQFVHGGAVGLDGRAVVIAGPSGAGKSTTTLACLLGGLDYLGDDYVLVGSNGGPTVHSLFSAAKLKPEQVHAFPELLPQLTNADQLATEKALWFVHRDFPTRTRAAGRAVAVLVPRVTGRTESTLEPIPHGTALAALAPSTIVQLSGADQGSLTAMAAFVAGLPAYRLEAGTDLPGVAAVVRSLLESAS
jgi:hypothetical protein